MNKKEAVQILAILKAAYPNSYKGMTKEEASGTVSVWAMQFSHMPADIVMMAINKMISTSPFPPAISEVKKKLGALHWEAYEMLQERYGLDPLPEPTIRQAKRVYDSTMSYRYDRSDETSLQDMLTSPNYLQLPGGDAP